MEKIIEKIGQLKRSLGSRISHWRGLWHDKTKGLRFFVAGLLGKGKIYGARFFAVMTHKKNLGRDAMIVSFVIFFLVVIFFGNNLFFYVMEKRSERFLGDIQEQENIFSEKQIYEEVRGIQDVIDGANWKKHQSQWYGFEISYPESWKNPINQAAARNAKWEYRYQFRKNEIKENNPYIGFDLVIYALTKTDGLLNTAEFPLAKNDGLCENDKAHIIETGDYAAEEIYVPPTDTCRDPILFFSYTRGAYIYNIVPMTKDGFSSQGDPRVEIVDNFPEFFEIISTLNPVELVRPKPKVAEAKPKTVRAKGPMPVAFKQVGGRLVCDKEDDKPSKSNKGKGKHLDMECCLDPDEYPNPNCYYDPNKYGKYL